MNNNIEIAYPRKFCKTGEAVKVSLVSSGKTVYAIACTDITHTPAIAIKVNNYWKLYAKTQVPEIHQKEVRRRWARHFNEPYNIDFMYVWAELQDVYTPPTLPLWSYSSAHETCYQTCGATTWKNWELSGGTYIENTQPQYPFGQTKAQGCTPPPAPPAPPGTTSKQDTWLCAYFKRNYLDTVNAPSFVNGFPYPSRLNIALEIPPRIGIPYFPYESSITIDGKVNEFIIPQPSIRDVFFGGSNGWSLYPPTVSIYSEGFPGYNVSELNPQGDEYFDWSAGNKLIGTYFAFQAYMINSTTGQVNDNLEWVGYPSTWWRKIEFDLLKIENHYYSIIDHSDVGANDVVHSNPFGEPAILTACMYESSTGTPPTSPDGGELIYNGRVEIDDDTPITTQPEPLPKEQSLVFYIQGWVQAEPKEIGRVRFLTDPKAYAEDRESYFITLSPDPDNFNYYCSFAQGTLDIDNIVDLGLTPTDTVEEYSRKYWGKITLHTLTTKDEYKLENHLNLTSIPAKPVVQSPLLNVNPDDSKRDYYIWFERLREMWDTDARALAVTPNPWTYQISEHYSFTPNISSYVPPSEPSDKIKFSLSNPVPMPVTTPNHFVTLANSSEETSEIQDAFENMKNGMSALVNLEIFERTLNISSPEESYYDGQEYYPFLDIQKDTVSGVFAQGVGKPVYLMLGIYPVMTE